MTVTPEALAGGLFQALLAASLAGLLLRGRRLGAGLLAAGIAGAAVAAGLAGVPAEPRQLAWVAGLAGVLGYVGPALGSARKAIRLGQLGRSDWSGGSKVVASERW